MFSFELQELDDIATRPARKALEQLLARHDEHRRMPVIVERTQALVIFTGPVQVHIPADDLDDISGLQNLLCQGVIERGVAHDTRAKSGQPAMKITMAFGYELFIAATTYARDKTL